jgi:AAA family ATP:ADP antiporter
MAPPRFTPFERFLQLFTKVRPGEGRTVAWFGLHVFLLLFAYYIVRTTREGIVLDKADSSYRSQIVAWTALVLMLFVPLYSAVRRRHDGPWLVNGVIALFVASSFGFWWSAHQGVYHPTLYFIWAGVFGVVVLSQFWALAADSFNVKSGQRLFPVILLMGNLGGLAGAEFCEYFIVDAPFGLPDLGISGMLMAVTITLAGTMLFTFHMTGTVPVESRAMRQEHEHRVNRWLGGFDVIRTNRFLLLIAVMVTIVNFTTSLGDQIWNQFVDSSYAALLAAGTAIDKAAWVTKVYGNYNFWVTLLTLVFQGLLVSRSIARFGVPRVLLVMPVISLLVYGLIAFVPIITMVKWARIVQASTDYSFNSATRHSLFLATDRVETYDGKTTIETFFWRFGDLLQFGAVWLNKAYGSGDILNLVVLNCALALVWVISAVLIGRHYTELAKQNMPNAAPHLTGELPHAELIPGAPFSHQLPHGLFEDADPGDVLTLTARCADGSPLPAWLRFDRHHHRFHCDAVHVEFEELHIEVTATDHDGESVSGTFVIRRVTAG